MACEGTDQYRTRNILKHSLDTEGLIDYGAFIVALAMFDEDRDSLMPTNSDIKDLYDEGFGPSPETIHRRIGLSRLQRALGFYSYSHVLHKEELQKRIEWIASHGAQADNATFSSFEDVIAWGAKRNLLPPKNNIYGTINGDGVLLKEFRQTLGVEIRNRTTARTYYELYRFGAKVLSEHGAPLSGRELDELYADAFVSQPYEAIRWQFGTLGSFWREFGYIPHARGLSRTDLIDIGLQWMIANNGEKLSPKQIDEQSAQGRFPSRRPISRRFAGFPDY
jgi:hypothetical protein